MSRVLIIGAGGVGNVVAQKCAQHPDVFQDIILASRTRSKCDAIAAEIMKLYNVGVRTAQVDADNVPELVALIKRHQAAAGDQRRPALPGPDHHGRLPRDRGRLPRHRQLRAARHRQVRVQLAVGLPGAVPGKGPHGAARLRLRSGRDQRLLRLRARSTTSTRSRASTSSTATPASHGQPFATNFNPEINIREVTADRAATGRTAGGSRPRPSSTTAASISVSTSPRHRPA